jgi:simple sugar transport system ATP-binding protein
MQPPRVQAIAISKSFGMSRALDDVSLDIAPGTFHAVVGENGAGKSTLAKCILGFYQSDSGTVKLDGAVVSTPAEANRAGLGMVFQHFTLAPSMTVAENLVLARNDLPTVLSWTKEKERLRRFLETAPFQVDLEAHVEHLAAGQKQKIEILKQLYLQARMLILDEPTSVLTPAESDEVMTVLRALVSKGVVSVMLITHKLREVVTYADHVTVLRRGRWIATSEVAKTDAEQIAGLMVGSSSTEQVVRASVVCGDTALEVRNLLVHGDKGLPAVKRLSVKVAAGEIVGVAGVSGNGQRELVQALGGQREIAEGTITAFGKPYRPSRRAIEEAGFFTLPEEPLHNATVSSMPVGENLALRTFTRPPFAKLGFVLDRTAIRQAAEEAVRRFSIRTPALTSPVRDLSGGNLQRLVLARDLGAGTARIMVVANPSFGLDFAAASSVHNLLIEMRNRGGAILLVSEDLDELLKVADRILVMSAGEIAHESLRAELDLAAVGRFMGGSASA